MGNHLHCTAQVLSVALLVEYVPIDLSCGQIAESVQVFIDESLVVPQVKVCLRSVLGDKDFPVLVRTHSARIDVDIRIQFLCRHLQPPGFEQPSQRRCRNSLAETRDHAACNKDVFFHNPSPFYLRCAKNKSAKTKKK